VLLACPTPPPPQPTAHTPSHARHRLVGGLGLLNQAKLLCDARLAQTRRRGWVGEGGVGGRGVAGSVWGLGGGVGTSVSAVACWRAPAPPIAVLRLQDELRQVLVQEEEADRSDGNAPPRGLPHEVGLGEADGLNESEVRTERRWVEDEGGASSSRRWARGGGARACVGYVHVHAQQLCVQRERDASGIRAAPAHGAHARVVGGGDHAPERRASRWAASLRLPSRFADGETITRDALKFAEVLVLKNST